MTISTRIKEHNPIEATRIEFLAGKDSVPRHGGGNEPSSVMHRPVLDQILSSGKEKPRSQHSFWAIAWASFSPLPDSVFRDSGVDTMTDAVDHSTSHGDSAILRNGGLGRCGRFHPRGRRWSESRSAA
jgi:hypothetical protein